MAKVRMRYKDGRVRAVPEVFVKTLVRLGLAAPEPGPDAAPPDPAPVAISPRTGKPKRQYRRRDLTAER